MASERLPRPTPRRSWAQRLVLAVGALLSVVLVVAAAGLGWGYWQFNNISRANVALSDVASGGPQNYLLVGSDSRAGGDPIDPSAKGGPALGQRSDTIMVLRIDPKQQAAVMLSLPRDLWVPIAGTGNQQRINAAYGLGKQVLVDTIEQDFGIPINHYVEIDFSGFQQVVQAVGGVPIWFDRAMRDSNSGLDIQHPGCVTLDGYQALAFARARHLLYMHKGSWSSDGTGDLGRISRQQLFIRRTIQRAVSKGLDNPLTLKHLIEAGTRNVTIDRGLSAQMLLALGGRFRSFDSNNLKSLTVPAIPFRTAGGAAVLKLDEAGAEPLLNIFRGRDFGAIRPGVVTATVLNSSGVGGQAANAAGALLQAGFKVDRWGNGSELGHATSARTLVRYAVGNQPAAELLGRHLSVDADIAEDPTLAPGQVVLFVGKDFTTVLANPKPAAAATTTSAVDSGSGSSTSGNTSVASTSSTTTTSTPIGLVPGDPPPGQSCS
ncbi:MAG: cell envelope-related transcriptional attenuator [Acidimicrobiales bacterium]|nr:cell envelope-related transcriptional attenuator [Acidimicrobiales bacterium]